MMCVTVSLQEVLLVQVQFTINMHIDLYGLDKNLEDAWFWHRNKILC